MNECKDCRHYRRRIGGNECGHPYSIWSSCEMHRALPSHNRHGDCGSEARFFEPIPLGKSHGIDWDRAAMIVEFSDMPPIEISEPVSMEEFFGPCTRFTIAEYLAALTTDYCAPAAAE